VNFFNLPNAAGGLNMMANSMPGLSMPSLPSTIAGEANLRLPAGMLAQKAMPMANSLPMSSLAMAMMGAANPEQQEMPMMQMPQVQAANAGKDAQAFAQQYGLDALLQRQSMNDNMMRQRMQGLLALLGGQ
jgi:hypothetical protein